METNDGTRKQELTNPVIVYDEYFFQYFVAFSGMAIACDCISYYNSSSLNYLASLLSFSMSVSYGWTSPSLPLLMDADSSPIPITSDESSWIVAIYVIGTIIGIIQLYLFNDIE